MDPDSSISTVRDANVFTLSMGQAGDASTVVFDGIPKAPSMRFTKANSPPLLDKRCTVGPAICKLPLELVSYIAELRLLQSYSGEEHMEALYSIRMISRTWRNGIDLTPSLWGVVTSEVPLYVNTTAVERSGTCPLDVYVTPCTSRSNRTQADQYRGTLELAAREIGRWSTVTLWLTSYDDCSQYLTSPAPLLRKLDVAVGCGDKPTTPIALFGGIAPRLETLEVKRLHMDWTSSFIQRLRVFKLSRMNEEQISIQQVLDILASAPLLENLCIENSTLNRPLQPLQTSPAVIQLPSLQTIHLQGVQATNIILSSIRAPSCTSLGIYGWEDDTADEPNFPERPLGHFNDFQRLTLSDNKKSTIHLFDESIEWECWSTSLNRLEFDMNIHYIPPAVGVGWATRVIGLGAQELVHDLELHLNHETLDDEDLAAYYSFSRCQSVTRIVIDDDHVPTEPILDLIGTWRESEDGIGPQPAFPGLRNLALAPWQEQALEDLEGMVNRRFGRREDLLNGRIPKLCIFLRMSCPDSGIGPKLDMIQLQRLRAATGVESVTQEFAKHARGMLAVVYDDDTGL
ncbi:hypothetical protein FRC04_002439 [Tulasnella sp. 424]|nr:hypothetical protein FRC04_002439 [Tulasnella sp. 424]KAG8967383.1 hypothetical protein FRC05_002093 [Tulasnella sp. 425]